MKIIQILENFDDSHFFNLQELSNIRYKHKINGNY
jgi:hypothetical protein